MPGPLFRSTVKTMRMPKEEGRRGFHPGGLCSILSGLPDYSEMVKYCCALVADVVVLKVPDDVKLLVAIFVQVDSAFVMFCVVNSKYWP